MLQYRQLLLKLSLAAVRCLVTSQRSNILYTKKDQTKKEEIEQN